MCFFDFVLSPEPRVSNLGIRVVSEKKGYGGTRTHILLGVLYPVELHIFGFSFLFFSLGIGIRTA